MNPAALLNRNHWCADGGNRSVAAHYFPAGSLLSIPGVRENNINPIIMGIFLFYYGLLFLAAKIQYHIG
jgi:hypothetical protein